MKKPRVDLLIRPRKKPPIYKLQLLNAAQAISEGKIVKVFSLKPPTLLLGDLMQLMNRRLFIITLNTREFYILEYEKSLPIKKIKSGYK